MPMYHSILFFINSIGHLNSLTLKGWLIYFRILDKERERERERKRKRKRERELFMTRLKL